MRGAATIAALLLLGAAPVAGRAQAPFQLALPIDCAPGRTCFVQNYTDHDPSPAAKDYACGPLTYDGHKGTDFRLPDLAAQRRGVKVLAAAPGVVLRMRDGTPDISIRDRPDRVPSDRACGNGLIIQHAGGWQTQYCHMAQGSLKVRPGQKVETGAVLGLVGLSGQTEFPHLHLSVREGREDVDPFAYGEAPGQCSGGRSLWRPDVKAALPYRARTVINAGFAAAVVSLPDVETGGVQPPGRGAEALYAYVRAIGLRQGDIRSLVLWGPNGAAIASGRSRPLDHDKAQWLDGIGRRRPGGQWPAGRYTLQYQVLNGGKVVLEQTVPLDL